MTVKGLNPYSNGMLTQFNLIKKYIWKQDWCLNPYSNGMLTQDYSELCTTRARKS